MKQEIIRISHGQYEDQYGFTHGCYWIEEKVTVEPTGETRTREYYGEVKDFYYESEDGRTWLNITATDYGAPSSWSLVQKDNEKKRDEHWVGFRVPSKGPLTHGGVPLIYGEAVSDE